MHFSPGINHRDKNRGDRESGRRGRLSSDLIVFSLWDWLIIHSKPQQSRLFIYFLRCSGWYFRLDYTIECLRLNGQPANAPLTDRPWNYLSFKALWSFLSLGLVLCACGCTYVEQTDDSGSNQSTWGIPRTCFQLNVGQRLSESWLGWIKKVLPMLCLIDRRVA